MEYKSLKYVYLIYLLLVFFYLVSNIINLSTKNQNKKLNLAKQFYVLLFIVFFFIILLRNIFYTHQP